VKQVYFFYIRKASSFVYSLTSLECAKKQARKFIVIIFMVFEEINFFIPLSASNRVGWEINDDLK
jgi:hypothetical protein